MKRSSSLLVGQRQRKAHPQVGFTLVELIMVMVLMGILSGSFMVFFKPTVEGYFDARRRADLTDIADTALRRMGQDIKAAVPNSINLVSDQCFQLVPTIAGGRYRTNIDVINDQNPPNLPATWSAFPDTSAATATPTTFDVLSMEGTAPVKDDYIVINNQNRDDVYGAAPISRFTVSADPTAPVSSNGTTRIVIGANPAAAGYVGGRFQVVSKDMPSIMYSCSGSKLFRKILTTSKVAACAVDGDVVATDVASCLFAYTSISSATQSTGLITLNLTLSRNGESVVLASGVHVDNQP